MSQIWLEAAFTKEDAPVSIYLQLLVQIKVVTDEDMPSAASTHKSFSWPNFQFLNLADVLLWQWLEKRNEVPHLPVITKKYDNHVN